MSTNPTPKISLEQEKIRLPVPSFTLITAQEKVRKAEDGWNSQDPVNTNSTKFLPTQRQLKVLEARH
ncbi:DUF1348 family protein [Colwellia psychrerythraea]|uniref:Uncharacterized protein n=1 Tax=Colwellia psychrerythraea TaxID=28229 RepID=A0A099KHV4_COLPS|nr:DUF1348 family protein [Colwellia psychrerythraea]KGJ89163.1 protein of unknown function DUF1348 [Colwellia psychrerythraea]